MTFAVVALPVAALAATPGVAEAGATGSPQACSTSAGADWPMYQHDASRSGAACNSGVGATNVATLVPQWVAQTADAVTATPTVSGNQVFAGDAGGVFYALDRATGSQDWTFDVRSNSCHDDRHNGSYGEITSTAAVASLPGGGRLVLFGGGATLYALDAASGRCVWFQDVDPYNPTSSMEIESSPVVVDIHGQAARVIVGSDSNEGPQSSAPTGVQAFDAASGTLQWKYEPENNTTFAGPTWPRESLSTNGCGDVWSSPAVDPGGDGGHGLVVFGTGNCPPPPAGPPVTVDSVVALNATNGQEAWSFREPPSDYTSTAYPDGGDTDFGSSPILTTLGTTPAVIEASKSGYVYALDEATGTKLLWATQAAQPGEVGDGAGGAIGGFIGAAALGAASLGGIAAPAPTWFGASAIPAPFTGQGIPSPDTSLACIDEASGYTPTAGSGACDPLRAASLHAVDATSGTVLWQAPVSVPSYSAVTYANGVVWAPSTAGFSLVAYDAGTGTPLWSFPLGAAVASGAAIAGSGVYVGSGISEGGTDVPGINGVRAFCLAGQCPTPSLPGT